MTEIALTNKELKRLVEIHNHFPDQKFYIVKQSSPSGIGPTTEVHLNLFEEETDTTINITDVSTW